MAKDKSTSTISLNAIVADAVRHLKRKNMILKLNFSIWLFLGFYYLLSGLFFALIEPFGEKLIAAHAYTTALVLWIFAKKYLPIILSMPLLLGMRWQAIRKCRDLPVRLIDQAVSYKYFLRITCVATIIMAIMAVNVTLMLSLKSLWLSVISSLVCVYIYFSFSLTGLLIIDKQLRPFAALRSSYRLVSNNWGIVLKVSLTEIFLLLLTCSFLLFRFIPVDSLRMHLLLTGTGKILQFLALLIVIPLNALISARMYTKIIEKEEHGRDAPKEEPVNLHLCQV